MKIPSCPFNSSNLESFIYMRDYALQFLGKTVTVKIDRPFGSKHPKHNIFYSLNYGYIENTIAPDGEEVDAYVLGVFEPIKDFIGRCVAVVRRSDDEDDKIVVAPEGVSYTSEQIKALVEFQERFFQSRVIMAG